jgi:hypothetical protein
MGDAKVRDVVGKIIAITQVTEKELTIKQGPKAGTQFKLYQIGVRIDEGKGNESWHNISAPSELKAIEVLQSQALKRVYQIGDEVKIYEESRDEKYWNVVSIVATGQSSLPEATAPKVTEESVEPNKKVEIKADAAVSHPPVKDEKTVSDYKIADADKYELGMAKNGAALILAAGFKGMDASNYKFIDQEYPVLVKKLFEHGKKLRQEILGY